MCLGGESGGGGSVLAAGDQVRVVKDSESLKQLQQENWDDLMADVRPLLLSLYRMCVWCVLYIQFIGTTGMIQHIAETGYLNVNYPGQATFPLNPEAVTKVNTHTHTHTNQQSATFNVVGLLLHV